MSGSGDTLFRPEALERLHAPDRLDVLLRLQDRRGWAPLLTLGLVLAAIVTWSVVGRIPVFAEGRGILVHQRDVIELQSPGAGYVRSVLVEEGGVVEPGTVIAWIDRPDLDTRLRLEREKLDDLLRRSRGALQVATVSGEDVFATARRLAGEKRAEASAAIEADRTRLKEQVLHADALADSRRERLGGERELLAEGLLSETDLAASEEAWIDSVDRAAGLRQRLDDLSTRMLEIEESYIDSVQRIQDREEILADARREISRVESELDEHGRIVANHRGRLIELSCGTGSYLAPGQRVGTLAVEDAASPLVGLTYFTVRDGKRIHKEMPVRISPDTVERERFGSLRGDVRRVSEFPVSLDAMEHLVGHRGVAESLAAGERRIQVWTELHPDELTATGYAWSSSRGPEGALTSGTTATVRVVIEERAPITFVLPFLRRSAGLN